MKLNFELKLGSFLGIVIVSMSLLSFFWVPHDYNYMRHENRFASPSLNNILGTDNFGRDIFSRIMAGGRSSLLLAVCTVTCAAVIGSVLGLLSGYLGGMTEAIITRLIDVINSFPGIIIALLMIAVLGNGQFTLFIALLILFIPSFTRVIRTGAKQYRDAPFIQAERILGASFFRIAFIHILPNLFPSLFSAVVIGLSNAILAESAMSYLGLGIQPPVPSWGRMLYESQTYFFTAPWAVFAPGIFITLTVIAFHFLGEGLRRRYGE
jgi:peptide/nickel transport system permease protein